MLLLHRQALVREGIHSLLARTESFRVASACGRLQDALARLQTHACDLILAELGGEGLQLAHRVSRLDQPWPLVLLAGERPNVATLSLALDYRAQACVNLQDPEDILRGLAAVVRRQRYLTPAWGLDFLRAHVPPPTAPLSDREREILSALDLGKSTAQAAAELHLAPNTVKSHLTRIHRKLGVKNRQQACRAARELGLIPLPPRT